jgi:CYTH domain-containing protein
MGTSSSRERESKYLVRALPPGLSKYPRKLIRQGYLAVDPTGAHVRIREIRHADGRTQHVMTVKSGGGGVAGRAEEEFPIPADVFARLWRLTRGARLEKTRYDLSHDGFTIELDVYRGCLRGLRVAEVEFESARQSRAFRPPAWLGPDVTGDDAYSNTRLAREGLRKSKPKSSKSRR